jgi:hypothetical protein
MNEDPAAPGSHGHREGVTSQLASRPVSQRESEPPDTDRQAADARSEHADLGQVGQGGREYELANLIIATEPDEMQSLRALAVVEAAAKGEEADLSRTSQALLREALASRLAELGLRWNPSSEAVERHASAAAKPDGPVARLVKKDRPRRYATIGLAVAVLITLWGGYVQDWTWTGFQANNQLWQWLQLLLLPVAIGTLPLWIQHPEYMTRKRRMAHLAAGAAFAALVLAGYLVPLKWTGFPGNTVWDWLELILLPIAVVSAPFLLSLLHSLRENQKRKIMVAFVAAVWALTIVGGYAWDWTWTGYHGNTLWDWLGLLLLPLLVPTVLLPIVLRWASVNTPNARPQADAKATRAS